MPQQVEVTATGSNTLTIRLPDGISVPEGQPVPPEVLEMVVAFYRLQSQEGAEEPARWCVGGCQGQIG
ncbi:hypothetical protein MPRS_54850 [Mycobacterium paraseoulense]|nr:hypothetical protein MPRS_54850 [Mycobacterium paraseoulense]